MDYNMARSLLGMKGDMGSLESQILALAGQGDKADDIASALRLEIAAVEMVLARHGLIEEDDIKKDDYRAILDGIIETAKHSTQEHLKLRAGMFIVEQKRNRENLKHAPALNILTINQLIQNAHGKVLQSLNLNESNQRGPERTIEAGQATTDPTADKEIPVSSSKV